MKTLSHHPKISLGPLLYYWERDKVFDFYESIASTPVDIVYIGETVCSKRRLMRDQDWLEIANRLKSAGKEVVLSTLTLIEASSELSKLTQLCHSSKYTIEANDIAAVNLLSGKQSFVTGPAVNIYNPRTLAFLASQGLKRWVMPIELSRKTLGEMQQQRPAAVETEVFAYGRLPLAYSARCFTARSHNLAKDDCQFRCLDDPDGKLLSTREGDPFLVLNGIQTQSASHCNLIMAMDEFIAQQVDVLRISPQSRHTEAIIKLFHDCAQGTLSSQDSSEKLEALALSDACDGYWYGNAGMDKKGGSEHSFL